MKKLRVLALMHEDLVPPEDTSGVDLGTAEWKTEYNVVSTLGGIGHEVLPLGVRSDLEVIHKTIEEWKPHIAFNLLEEFDGVAIYDQNVIGYLELLGMPYTGCNPRGLMLARDKSLSKKILAYHRIPYPDFAFFPMGRAARRHKRLAYPMIVKSVSQEASLGISQASIVDDDDKLRERVAFIHNSVGTDAIAERFIEGRELYVGVLGNMRLQVLPVWELFLDGLPDEVQRIATARVKWNPKYQKKYGITSGPAEGLPNGMQERIQHLAKRIYRALNLSGYARIDLRLDPNGKVYVLEANPNPEVALQEDFAKSSQKAGTPYADLLQRIVNLGFQWRPDRLG
ncbi:MAG: ATP-grasp domain-containing protein [Deltaproteobacteria bacterium]|nr:ATP-grasp domain-containing protein [Deltaproteobacteria bacterium]